jgi:hypothetical protein
MGRALAVLACVFAPGLGHAQSETLHLPRNDTTVSIAWFGAEYPQLERYNRWRGSLFAGLAGGHYWTDHMKTEVEAAWLSHVNAESHENLVLSGTPTYAESRYRIQNIKLSIGQSYQFGRNAWVHPFVGAGVDIDRVHLSEDRPAQFRPSYSADRTSRAVHVPARHESETTVRAHPFVKTGLKMYASERGFFTTELKLGLRSGVDQVLWKVGIGVDF